MLCREIFVRCAFRLISIYCVAKLFQSKKWANHDQDLVATHIWSHCNWFKMKQSVIRNKNMMMVILVGSVWVWVGHRRQSILFCKYLMLKSTFVADLVPQKLWIVSNVNVCKSSDCTYICQRERDGWQPGEEVSAVARAEDPGFPWIRYKSVFQKNFSIFSDALLVIFPTDQHHKIFLCHAPKYEEGFEEFKKGVRYRILLKKSFVQNYPFNVLPTVE